MRIRTRKGVQAFHRGKARVRELTEYDAIPAQRGVYVIVDNALGTQVQLFPYEYEVLAENLTIF